MITRRQFIQTAACVSSGATVTLIFTSLGSSAGCSSNDGNDNMPAGSTSPTEPANKGCDGQGGIGATSSQTLGHTHDVCVAGNDLTNPPSGGRTYQTTNRNNHVHSITLSAAQLSALERGETVTVTTNTVLLHTHTFSVHRA